MPWHCPPLTLAGHAYQAPREWIYDARGAFAALIKAGDAETAELFLGSVRSQVEGLKGAPDPRTAALAVDFQAWMLAELDLIAPLSRPGAAQEPGEPPPEPEPPPAAAARPGPPQEPDEAALGEPVDYPDDPLPEPPDFSDLERDTASLRAGLLPEEPGPVEAAYLLEGRRYPLAELLAAYEALAADESRDAFAIRRVWEEPAHVRGRRQAYEDCRHDHAVHARMVKAEAVLKARLKAEQPRKPRQRATKPAEDIDPVAAMRAG
jgi:hypothetical protein